MLQTLFQHVIAYLHHHPHSAGIIVFFVACAEALAVVGTIIPGSITLTAIGILIGSKVIPAYSTIIWAVCGAVLGDSISYAIGLHYKSRIHKIWPFKKFPNWLDRGERFFRKHGGKSIIIGRFFGPARSMVPLIAGTFNMRPGRFLLAAIPSASIWAIGYLIPGILLGAISLELPPSLAFEFIIAVLLVISFFVFLTWLIHFCSRYLAQKIDKKTEKIWQTLRHGKKSHWITELLTDPRNPENHHQLISAVYTIIVIGLFSLLMLSVLTHDALTALNLPIANLLRSLRTNIIDNITLVVTIFASKQVMLISGLFLFLWLGYKRYWRLALHWLALLLIIAGSIGFIKLLFFLPRPDFILHVQPLSSFPSGHVCLTIGLFGFLAVLIAQELESGKRRIPYIITTCFVVLVSFSRLYLTAHWLTDIIESILLGLIIVLVVVISYRRRRIRHIAVKQLVLVTASIFLVVTLIFSFYKFAKLKQDYSLYWPTHTITMRVWQEGRLVEIPLWRPDRFGHPLEVFNVEWLSNLANIKQSLLKQGWKPYEPNFTMAGILDRLATSSTSHPLPLLPQKYHNKYPVLLMTKEVNHNKQAMILRLWQNSIKIKNQTVPLWLGIVNYRYKHHKWFEIHKNHKRFFGAADDFVPFLKNFKWQKITYPKAKQPKETLKLHWDGKLLLIRNEQCFIKKTQKLPKKELVKAKERMLEVLKNGI